MKCTVRFRGKGQKQFQADTVGALRLKIQQHLTSIGGIQGTAWGSNPEIVLFAKNSAAALDDDAMHIDGVLGKDFFAFEKFTTVPVHLNRHVKFSQICPVVRVVHGNTQFTEFAPLFCTSLNNKEKNYPHFCIADNKVKVHGASLFGCDDYTQATSLMPSDDITPHEAPGAFCVPRSNFGQEASEFGILRAPQLLDGHGEMVPDYKDTLNKNSTTVKKRSYFCRFRLSLGTNLADVGMAVIYDNYEDGHFTLIPEEDRFNWTPNTRWWGNMHLLEPRAGSTAAQQPEAFLCRISGSSNSLVFPLAAQKFEFHDFIMKASALPWDMKFLDGDSNDDDEDPDKTPDKKVLGEASNTVFKHCGVLYNTHDALTALDVLHKNEFNWKLAPLFCFEVLRSAIDELLSADENTIEEREKETLIEGDRNIGKVLKKRSETTPTQVDELPAAAEELPAAEEAVRQTKFARHS